jgi:hypothetical protein
MEVECKEDRLCKGTSSSRSENSSDEAVSVRVTCIITTEILFLEKYIISGNNDILHVKWKESLPQQGW